MDVHTDTSNPYTQVLKIPAYDHIGRALVIELMLFVTSNNNLNVVACGEVAKALSPLLKRIIDIMSEIKASWGALVNYNYILKCKNKNFIVNDAKSAGLAISIALLNFYRFICGKKQIENITGTGLIRIDGSIQNTKLESKKEEVIRNCYHDIYFITSNICDHLYDLEIYMDNLSKDI